MFKVMPRSDCHRLLSPRIACLVSSISISGKTNFAPVSNVTSISTEPQRVCIAVTHESTTRANIESTGTFGVNIPSTELLGAVWIAGSRYSRVSLPNGASKFSAAGLTADKATVINAPLISECYAALECTVFQSINVGDHMLFLADIVAARVREDLLNSEARLIIQKARPLMQNSGNLFCGPGPEMIADTADATVLMNHNLSKSKYQS